jgi:hypothetical protein
MGQLTLAVVVAVLGGQLLLLAVTLQFPEGRAAAEKA